MKLVFLDVDGVLNHELFYRGRSKYSRRMDRPFSEIDQESVEILNSLIKQTDAKVVISASMRKTHSVEELRGFLVDSGFVGEVIDKTPSLGEGNLRGNEILKWIKDNQKIVGAEYYKYKNYVIFDDDSDMLYWQKDNFIHIDRYCGITPNDVWKAEKILNNGIDLTGW